MNWISILDSGIMDLTYWSIKKRRPQKMIIDSSHIVGANIWKLKNLASKKYEVVDIELKNSA